PDSTDTELGGYVREFETRVRQDMDEIYLRLDDEQTERQLLAGRLNMLFRDRQSRTAAGADHSPTGIGDSRDSRDLLGTLHIQSRQRRLVAVHRLDLFFYG
nr:hypothetical protein [Tanacetum cinerariifolium]